jgi:hypothetical protein
MPISSLQIEISRLYKTHEVVVNDGRIEKPKPHCIIMKPIWAMVEQANFASHLPEEV